jgi:hypothetical protein
MLNKEYLRVPKAVVLPPNTFDLKKLDVETWKKCVFHFILAFYNNHNSADLKIKITREQLKENPRVEILIATYIRKYLRGDPVFSFDFEADGEVTNDEEIEGNYDIVISNTYWNPIKFYFECKNLSLDSKKNLINEYVFVKYKKDGGVYRYFNGKYANHQDFGGMLGFILGGDIATIKNKIVEKLQNPFDISPEGDFIRLEDNSIEGNSCTFSSFHNRKSSVFKLYHILFDLQ